MDALAKDASRAGAIFSANRATGHVAFSVTATSGASRRSRVYEAGSLRVRFPNGHGHGNGNRNGHRDGSAVLDAVLVNTAGGMTGGDRFDIDIAVGADARLIVTSAAAEKIYRSLGPDTEAVIRLDIAPGGQLAWLPQETIMFDRARLHRTIDVDLAGGGAVLLAEAIVFGRAAMGETLVFGHLFDRWRVRVEGTLVFAETIRLGGAIAEQLLQPAVAAGGAAIASVLRVPGDDAAVAQLRAMQQSFVGEVGASAWNGLAAARLVAPDGAALRRDLLTILAAWSAAPLPRLWLN